MITLDSITRSLQLVTAASAAVTEPHYVASYVEIDGTGGTLTPTTGMGQTTGATPVTAVAHPASGKQRRLTFLSVFNADTAASTLTVQVDDNGTPTKVGVFTLLTGEQLLYSPEGGFVVMDAQGGLKSTMTSPASQLLKGHFDCADLVTTLTMASGTAFALYLGRCGKNSSLVNLIYKVTTALGATISYAEVGIFKGTVNLNGNPTLTRLGFTDVSTQVNGTGIQTPSVTLTTPAQPGDDLWVVFGFSTSGTAAAFRAGLADDIQSGVWASLSGRPSTIAAASAFTLEDAVTARPWVMGYVK